MKKKHWAQVTIIVVVIAMLAAAGVSHAAAPVSSQSIEFTGSSSLPAHLSLSPGGEGWGEGETLHITINTSSAAYPLTIDPLFPDDQAVKLIPSYVEDYAEFGNSVAISGDTIVIGAESESSTDTRMGAAYVFERDQGGTDNWGQVRKLIASDPDNYDCFGSSVAISGDWIVVGARGEEGLGSGRGAAYVYERNRFGPDSWGEVKKLMALNASDYAAFGNSVAISADTIVIGAYTEAGAGLNRGAAYVFERNWSVPDNWGQRRKLIASDPSDSDWFGFSVSISADTIVIGSPDQAGDGSDRGAAYIYERHQGGTHNWGQVKKLKASNPEDHDRFGDSVSISADTIVVGAYLEDGKGTDRGAAYVYNRNEDGADNWGQVKKIRASDPENHDEFGFSVSISGDIVIVGADHEDGDGSKRGAAYIYERNQGGADSWGQLEKLTASDPEDTDEFGFSVAISGETVVIGAPNKDGVGTYRGAAYVFDLLSYQTYMPLVIRDN